MIQIYFTCVSWISGITFFVAFLLTFWPSRARVLTAAALWTVATFVLVGFSSYWIIWGANFGYAFNHSAGFPLFGWLLPLSTVAFALAESCLLFPWVFQSRALFLGRIIYLLVAPLCAIILYLRQSEHNLPFPLGAEWLGHTLLWFRIRERLQ